MTQTIAPSARPRTRLTPGQLHELTRWNTPSVYNGWEQITAADTAMDGFNIEPTTDFMPDLQPMAGYATTVVIESGNRRHRDENPDAVMEYLRYVAAQPGPTIAVVQDLDRPAAGSFWGEVNSNIHRALGCVGTITDGSVRDIVEMSNIGFKTLARSLCVGHAVAWPIRWGCEVEVFGRKIQPGQLIHADRHGFLAIPPEDEQGLFEATRFMDEQECHLLIPLFKNAAGKSKATVLDDLEKALVALRAAMKERFSDGRAEF